MPGGRLLFHDIFRGIGEPPIYPAPWAEDESISSLATEAAARSHMDSAGLAIEQWLVTKEPSLAFFKRVAALIEKDGPPPIGIHLLMGDNAADKLRNYVRNLTEQRVSVAMGMGTRD